MIPITNDLINEIVPRVVIAVNPEEIILFGSYAWGTPHKYSDIDLCVIVPNDISGFNRIEWGVRALNALDDLIVDVDILVKTRLDVEMFKSVPASLTKKIVEQGKYLNGQGKTYTNQVNFLKNLPLRHAASFAVRFSNRPKLMTRTSSTTG